MLGKISKLQSVRIRGMGLPAVFTGGFLRVVLFNHGHPAAKRGKRRHGRLPSIR
jgi:hypothetical protein